MKDQRLVLYNAFSRVYASMREAIVDLRRIGIDGLGFNAVWLNPINSTSRQSVNRDNFESYIQSEVTGSLYATYDYAQLNHLYSPT
jgi:hypothetical protein